jgi:hypothetical protein
MTMLDVQFGLILLTLVGYQPPWLLCSIFVWVRLSLSLLRVCVSDRFCDVCCCCSSQIQVLLAGYARAASSNFPCSFFFFFFFFLSSYQLIDGLFVFFFLSFRCRICCRIHTNRNQNQLTIVVGLT